MPWAIRNCYRSKLFPTDKPMKYLLGRYAFSHEQQEHMTGYQIGVFETRQIARDWLKSHKGTHRNAWSRQFCKGMSVVQVKVTVKETV